jgi:hypothetical protein
MSKLEEDQLLSHAQLAERWGCHQTTVWRRLIQHQIKVVRFSRSAVRVRLSDVLRLEQELTDADKLQDA